MPTFIGQIRDNQIILVASIAVSGEQDADRRSYNALLDTGSQVTMISKKVVDEVGLSAIGHRSILPVTGKPVDTQKYRVRLGISIGSKTRMPDGGIQVQSILRDSDLEVALLPYEPENHDVLLGMDLLVGFHLTLYGSNFILSN